VPRCIWRTFHDDGGRSGAEPTIVVSRLGTGTARTPAVGNLADTVLRKLCLVLDGPYPRLEPNEDVSTGGSENLSLSAAR